MCDMRTSGGPRQPGREDEEGQLGQAAPAAAGRLWEAATAPIALAAARSPNAQLAASSLALLRAASAGGCSAGSGPAPVVNGSSGGSRMQAAAISGASQDSGGHRVLGHCNTALPPADEHERPQACHFRGVKAARGTKKLLKGTWPGLASSASSALQPVAYGRCKSSRCTLPGISI